MNADLRGLVRDLMPALDAYEMAGRRSYHKDGALHWEMTAQYWEAQRLRERAEAALSVAQGQGWRPIESAPRDGRARLVYVPLNKCIFCVSWREPYDAEDAVMYPAGWYFFGGSGRLTMDPSHYAELPAAPAQPDGVKL